MSNSIDFITMYIIRIVYFVTILSCVEARKCSRVGPYGLEYYCCIHFEPTTDGCQECQPGYISSNGSNCQPCKMNYHGIRCLNMCSCSDNRICDNVKGCVTQTQTFETTGSECRHGFISSDGNACQPCMQNYYGKGCVKMCRCSGNEICDNVHGCLTQTQIFGTKENDATAEPFVKFTKQVDIDHSKANEYRSTNGIKGGTTGVSTVLQKSFKGGWTNEMIYIYIIITGMIAVAIGICVLCRKRTTAILYGLKKKRKTSPHNYQLQVVDMENSQREESTYNIMDEQKMPGSTEDENNFYDYGW